MKRWPELDLLKGLAILLVVFGHLVSRNDPQNVGWYEPLRQAVYAFHMPLFLYVSGYVAMLSGTLMSARRGCRPVIMQRARRLLLPFFSLGALILLGKVFAMHWMFVDNTPAGLAAGTSALFWDTQHSPALSLWYLFVLFTVSVTAMLLLNGQIARLPWLIVAALLLYFFNLPPICYLDHIGTYAVFFMAGAGAASLGERWLGAIARYWPAAMLVFLASLGGLVLAGTGWPQKLIMLPVGAFSMPAIHGMLRVHGASCPRILHVLGRYSFMIYLFNTLFIGLAKGVLLKFVGWDGAHFLPFALALMLAGTGGPIALKRYGLRRIQVLDRLTR